MDILKSLIVDSSICARCTYSDLQLHGDDVYFTLEQDVVQQREGVVASNTAPSKVW